MAGVLSKRPRRSKLFSYNLWSWLGSFACMTLRNLETEMLASRAYTTIRSGFGDVWGEEIQSSRVRASEQ